MKLHPRVPVAAKAEAEMATAIASIVDKYDLTCGEILSGLAAIQMRWAKYQVRDERSTPTELGENQNA